jgi:SnoaL-like domain
MSATGKAAVTRFFEQVWGEGRLEALETLVDRGYRSHIDEVGAGRMVRWVGPDILRVELSAYRSGLPDCRVEVTAIVAEGDDVIALFTVEGTNTATTVVEPLSGVRDVEIEPTQMAIRATGTAAVRVEAGRIAALAITWELLGPIEQIRLFAVGTLNVRDLVITPALLEEGVVSG